MATEPHTHPEQQPPREPPREREVIVTDTGDRRRSGMAGVVVAVLAIIVIAIVAVVVINAIDGVTDGEGSPVEVPSEIDVNVDDGST